MIKVRAHGKTYNVKQPQDGSIQQLTDVVFVEYGRAGANAQLSESTRILDELLGKQTGLAGFRTHTQPILTSEIPSFPLEQEFPKFINRMLSSFCIMPSQKELPPQNVEGRPTYFATFLADKPADDVDTRLSNSDLMKKDPGIFDRMITSKAQVEITDGAFANRQLATQPVGEQPHFVSSNQAENGSANTGRSTSRRR